MSEFQPTNQYVIDRVVFLAGPLTLANKFYDLGAGDGRWVKAFADAGAIAVGIERDSALVGIANNYLSGVANASMIEGDVYAQDYSDGTHFWVTLNYRQPILRLDEVKALIPSGALVAVMTDMEWGWPIVKMVNIAEGIRTTAMSMMIRGSQDWNLIRDLTVQQILDNYDPIVHPHNAHVGAASFPIYQAP